MSYRAETQRFHKVEKQFGEFPHPVEIDWEKNDRNSTEVHRWTIQMKLENHRDYIVVNIMGARVYRFKDPNIAMMFKLAWF